MNLKFLGLPYSKYIKIAKQATCGEDFLCGDDFGAFLAIFCSYGCGANASEAVEKSATGEKHYYKLSLLKEKKQKRLFTYNTSSLAKRL